MKSNNGKKKSKKKANKKDDDLKFINDAIYNNKISRSEIETLSNIDHPLFSFKYLIDFSIDKCKDHSFFHDFLIRLQKLSELGWKEIRVSGKHEFGIEKITRDQIKPKDRLPKFITPEVELDVFRANGDNRPFVGKQDGKIFYIFFIETNFGDVYDH